MVKVVSDIAMACDRGLVTIMMMLDLSAAFDTVDHSILLSRLESKFGLTGTVLSWCKSYLAHRTQTVYVNGKSATTSILRFGVPQGSILGPLFFILYTSPVLDIIEQAGLLGHLYADDSQCYQHCTVSELPNAVGQLQTLFDSLLAWMSSNRLKLNAAKTEIICFGSKYRLGQITIDSGDMVGLAG